MNPENPDDPKANFWRGQLPLETETCFFILVNALDVIVTYMLLNHGPEFQESNPAANWLLARYGFRGMVYFKFGLVALVTVITQIIAIRDLRTAKRLLVAGTVIVGLVVVYSCKLWVKFSGYFA